MGLKQRSLAAAVGYLADRAVGEPPDRAHPVALFGKLMGVVEGHNYRDTRAAGVLHCALGAGIGVVSGLATRSVTAATWVSVGGKALADVAGNMQRALDAGDLGEARRMLPALVGRDPEGLDEKEIARAVVESIAENTVDAVVAPVLWAAVAGASGTLGYRAINTLDAMVGHRSKRYLRYGWASARLDDLAGWVPARVTALLVAIVRPGSAAAVLRAVRSQAPHHPSPNSGVAEAAFAAALGIRLGGRNRYGDRVEFRPSLGTGHTPEPSDIERAISLSRDATTVMAVLLASFGLSRLRWLEGLGRNGLGRKGFSGRKQLNGRKVLIGCRAFETRR